MSDWSLSGSSYPSCSYNPYPYYTNKGMQQASTCQPPTQAQPTLPPAKSPAGPKLRTQPPKGESSRETRNKAEKQRRDKMTQSIYRLASLVPPVASSGKKVDKTSVLRLTAHFLRSHHHVFGKSLYRGPKFSVNFTRSFLKSMKGFLLTSTYKGLVVVVSPNVQEYLGYTECELLGQSLYSIVHPDDHQLLKKQLYPKCCRLTSNGELFLSKDVDAAKKAAEALMNEKRTFLLRLKKQTHLRTEPMQYLTCHVEGAFRKSDRAGVYVDTVVQVGRRVRSRGNNPYASGNDIVFIGMIRPITDTFATESKIECFTMEYRTRHSIDGGIIQCEQRIALITGYMVNEVKGVNAMNFMHRDDVRWVIVALREMYVNHRLMGESCYRLMTKNGRFIYLRTRGALEVDADSKATTSFVCTNTLVPEQEGIELIRLMKNKFSLKINNEELKEEDTNINPEVNEKQFLPVEDPRQLEQVIYHLVTDLPSPQPEENIPKSCEVSRAELAIIPPEKEQIKKAIQKSYSVIKNLRNFTNTENMSYDEASSSNLPSSTKSVTPDGSENIQLENNDEVQLVQNVPENDDSVDQQNQLAVIHDPFPDIDIDGACANLDIAVPECIDFMVPKEPPPFVDQQLCDIDNNTNKASLWQPNADQPVVERVVENEAVFDNEAVFVNKAVDVNEAVVVNEAVIVNEAVVDNEAGAAAGPAEIPMACDPPINPDELPKGYNLLMSPPACNMPRMSNTECCFEFCTFLRPCPFHDESEQPTSSFASATTASSTLSVPMELSELTDIDCLINDIMPTLNQIINELPTEMVTRAPTPDDDDMEDPSIVDMLMKEFERDVDPVLLQSMQEDDATVIIVTDVRSQLLAPLNDPYDISNVVADAEPI